MLSPKGGHDREVGGAVDPWGLNRGVMGKGERWEWEGQPTPGRQSLILEESHLRGTQESLGDSTSCRKQRASHGTLEGTSKTAILGDGRF